MSVCFLSFVNCVYSADISVVQCAPVTAPTAVLLLPVTVIDDSNGVCFLW